MSRALTQLLARIGEPARHTSPMGFALPAPIHASFPAPAEPARPATGPDGNEDVDAWWHEQTAALQVPRMADRVARSSHASFDWMAR